MKINVETKNAIRSVARQCHAEMKLAQENNSISLHDRLHTAILDKYAKQFARFCLPGFEPKRWLQWYVMQIDKESL